MRKKQPYYAKFTCVECKRSVVLPVGKVRMPKPLVKHYRWLCQCCEHARKAERQRRAAEEKGG